MQIGSAASPSSISHSPTDLDWWDGGGGKIASSSLPWEMDPLNGASPSSFSPLHFVRRRSSLVKEEEGMERTAERERIGVPRSGERRPDMT